MANTTQVPVTGDMYRCASCGLEIHVTKGCQCQSPRTVFECCDKPMKKVTEPAVQNP